MKNDISIIKKIVKPTLLLDKKKAKTNIKAMTEKAQKSSVKFRPHFKTHQSAQIGEWFKDFGIDSITVSSVDMAVYFAAHGWQDITIAFPVNVLEINKINKLAGKITLNLLVESKETIQFLKAYLKNQVRVWFKIDTGYHRTGLLWDDFLSIRKLAQELHKNTNMSFAGLLTHSGHTYRTTSVEQIKNIYQETVFRLKHVQKKMQIEGFSEVAISIGDTPSCSIIKNFEGVDEIRPGNFVFYDISQLNLRTCCEEQIAVGVSCPVVAKHSHRNEIVIYGGSVHLSKEFISAGSGRKIFGCVTQLKADCWGPVIKKTYLDSLSQEHGIIKAEKNFFNNVQIGNVLVILPIHSCLTANLIKNYLTFDGDEISTMPT